MTYGEEGTIGQWSLVKLDILRTYLPAYQAACRRARDCYCIDAFAGKGEWRVRGTDRVVEGSPQIVLDYLGGFTQVFMIEMEAKRARELEYLKERSSHPSKVTVIVGDTNVVLSNALRSIHPKAPTFVFLDPSGDQLQWATIELLAKWQTELFILYPYGMTIARYLKRDPDKQEQWEIDRLNTFFGCENWNETYRDCIAGRRKYLESELLDLYTERLRGLGYKYCFVSRCFRTIDERHGQKLYYMIWVGKHPVGGKIIRSVLGKMESGPQATLGLNLDTV